MISESFGYLFQQFVLSTTIFILTCSSLGSAKPFLRENQSFKEQIRESAAKIQVDVIQAGERVFSEFNVTIGFDKAPETPLAHNRTTRSAGNWCIQQIDRVWDNCRKKYVDKFKCRSQHVSCQQAITKHNKPKCVTVYGYPQLKFVSKCDHLPMDCQCAD